MQGIMKPHLREVDYRVFQSLKCKVPFFVGARGFEPRASWSQIIPRYLLQRKKGDSESGRVHTAHTVHDGAEILT